MDFERKQLVEDAVGQLSEAELLQLKFRPFKKYDRSKKFQPAKPKTIENLLNEKARQVWRYANDSGIIDEKNRVNLKRHAIVGVGMQGVVIRSVDAAKSEPFSVPLIAINKSRSGNKWQYSKSLSIQEHFAPVSIKIFRILALLVVSLSLVIDSY